MNVGWSRRAIRLESLRKYIAKDSEQKAVLVAKRTAGRVLGTRELVVPDTPYIIPYRVRRERLELIAVFHGRQKWPVRL
jgi:toxin ParE1/3/4